MKFFQDLLNKAKGGIQTFGSNTKDSFQNLLNKSEEGLKTGLEKFGNFMGGVPSKEEINKIRKNNPQMDIFKSDVQLKNEGLMRDKDPITNETVIRKIEAGQFDSRKDSNLDPIYGGMKPKEFYGMLEQMGERGANRKFLRSGIQALANAPLIGGMAALEAAKNVGDLTASNMSSMAYQNAVLSQNPTKQKIAGKYFL